MPCPAQRASQRRPESAVADMLPSAEVLDDLCSRFILNVPAEELGWACFQRLLLALMSRLVIPAVPVSALCSEQVLREAHVPGGAGSLVL